MDFRPVAKTLTGDFSALYWTQELGPTCRRVERAIMLLTALKPDRMGAERARLLKKEQRLPFVLTQSVRSVSQIRFPAYYTTN